MLYSTYLGGTGNDQAQALAIDGAGNAYLAGITQSNDFAGAGGGTAPKLGAGTGGDGGNGAFVAKLSAVADLVLTASAAPNPVGAGQNVTYTFGVSNAGPDGALAVTLSDPLPANTTFVSLSAPAGWTCTTPAVGSGGTVTSITFRR